MRYQLETPESNEMRLLEIFPCMICPIAEDHYVTFCTTSRANNTTIVIIGVQMTP
jgi:hypothetical protein